MKVPANSLFLSLLFWCSALELVANENWPQFRGPTGQGYSDSKGVPLHWSETENIKWKTAIPGQGWSSPVVFGDRIWMMTALESGKSLRAICVDRDNGNILDNVEVFTVESPKAKHDLNSYASPTPVVEKDRVFVHFGTYGTACLDTTTAKVFWKNQQINLDHEVGPGSSPALLRDQLIIPCDGMDVQYLIALDKVTGLPVWKTDRPDLSKKSPPERKAYSTPLIIRVDGAEQIVSAAAYYAFGYAAETGREIWRVRYEGNSNIPRPIYADGLVYICTGFSRPQIWAIRPDGSGDITASHVVWKYLKQVPQKPSPIFADGRIYFVSDSGIATCLNAGTGREIWQERIEGEYSASPILVGKNIYFFSHDGKTVVLSSGESFHPMATNQLGSGFMASPAVAGKSLFLRSKTHLYRVEN